MAGFPSSPCLTFTGWNILCPQFWHPDSLPAPHPRLLFPAVGRNPQKLAPCFPKQYIRGQPVIHTSLSPLLQSLFSLVKSLVFTVTIFFPFRSPPAHVFLAQSSMDTIPAAAHTLLPPHTGFFRPHSSFHYFLNSTVPSVSHWVSLATCS